MTWIKICGTTSAEDATLAVEAGANAVGLIFAPSPRRVTAETAGDIVRSLPAAVEKVGVFVNETPERVLEIAVHCGLTAVQLHGDEDAAYIRRLCGLAAEQSLALRVFKAIAVDAQFQPRSLEFLQQALLDGLLLDTAPASGAAHRGGTGATFDWEHAAEVLKSVPDSIRIVAGGGLSPANVGRAIAVLEPWGVDVCSGVEREPGRKDAAKVKAFVAAVRTAANH